MKIGLVIFLCLALSAPAPAEAGLLRRVYELIRDFINNHGSRFRSVAGQFRVVLQRFRAPEIRSLMQLLRRDLRTMSAALGPNQPELARRILRTRDQLRLVNAEWRQRIRVIPNPDRALVAVQNPARAIVPSGRSVSTNLVKSGSSSSLGSSALKTAAIAGGIGIGVETYNSLTSPDIGKHALKCKLLFF